MSIIDRFILVEQMLVLVPTHVLHLYSAHIVALVLFRALLRFELRSQICLSTV